MASINAGFGSSGQVSGSTAWIAGNAPNRSQRPKKNFLIALRMSSTVLAIVLPADFGNRN
jgi:hypothetical protein